MNESTKCYGRMCPGLLRLPYNIPAKGSAFSVTVHSCGLGIQRIDVDTDMDAWERCNECPQYRKCHDLSLAKLTLASGLTDRF